MKKRIFIETVRKEASAKLNSQKAQSIVGIAICISEDSLPRDPVAAAKHLVARISLIRRDVPTLSN